MKLLIVTQVVDKNHPILSFFHRWIEEFAKNCDQVTVVCLEKGYCSLPNNVTVYSLGKEEKAVSSIVYAWRLNVLSWKLRKEYDAVFVHMIPEYVIAGALTWKILRKKIGLWYTHGSVSRSLRLAEKIVFKIFTAAQEGFNLRSEKILVTGHGIDTERFTHVEIPQDVDLLTIGRISLAKNLKALVDVLLLVRKEYDVSLTIVGEPVSKEDELYKQEVVDYSSQLGLSEHVHFSGSSPQSELPKILSRTRVFIHAATNGSLDKVLLEALSTGVPVVSMAEGAASLPLGNWFVSNVEELAEKASEILRSTSSDNMSKLQLYIRDSHSLQSLIPKICQKYSR